MPNVWRQFAQLLPEAPLLLGTVLAEHARRHGDGATARWRAHAGDRVRHRR